MAFNIKLSELRGSNNKTVGSSDYFKHLNKNTAIVRYSVKRDDSISYYSDLCARAADFKSALNDIYSDILKHKDMIWLVDEKLRTSLRTFAAHLDDFARFLNYGNSNARKIYEILNSDKSSSGITAKEASSLAKQAKKDTYINKKYASDVQAAKDFKYKDSLFKGNCGKGIFSDDYKEQIEKQIFSKKLDGKYHKYGYKSQIIDDLNKLIELIINDLSKGSDDNYIESQNQKNIKLVFEEFYKLGDDSRSKANNLLAKFDVEDITIRLQQIMHDSESDVPDKFKKPMVESIGSIVLNQLNPLESNISIEELLFEWERLTYFISMVDTKMKYDLKNNGEWTADKYRYDGNVYRGDCTGNIVFGYFGMAMGIIETVLYVGAGVAQVASDLGNIVNKIDKASGAEKVTVAAKSLLDYRIKWGFGIQRGLDFGDNPGDQQYIRIGVNYYNSCH